MAEPLSPGTATEGTRSPPLPRRRATNPRAPPDRTASHAQWPRPEGGRPLPIKASTKPALTDSRLGSPIGCPRWSHSRLVVVAALPEDRVADWSVSQRPFEEPTHARWPTDRAVRQDLAAGGRPPGRTGLPDGDRPVRGVGALPRARTHLPAHPAGTVERPRRRPRCRVGRRCVAALVPAGGG